MVVSEGGAEIILDPVHDRFDEEVPYLDKLDIDMKLEILNGTPRVGDSGDIAALRGLGDVSYILTKGERERGTGRGVTEIAEQKAQEAGLSLAQLEAQKRAEYIARHGYSPEEGRRRAEAARQEILRKAEEAKRRQEALAHQKPESVSPKWTDKVTKIFPVTALLRAGIRFWLRKDMRVPMAGPGGGLATRLAPALLDVNRAREAYADMGQWGRLKSVFERLKLSYVRAGGRESEFVAAIRAGAAGKVLSGLGEPGTAAAITAAT